MAVGQSAQMTRKQLKYNDFSGLFVCNPLPCLKYL